MLPVHLEGLVFLYAEYVLEQLVALQLDEVLVAHVATERPVAESLVVPVLHCLDIDKLALLVKQA